MWYVYACGSIFCWKCNFFFLQACGEQVQVYVCSFKSRITLSRFMYNSR